MPADLEKGRQSGNAESLADESDNGSDFQPRPSNGGQSSAQSFSKAHSTLFSVFLYILQGENAGTNVFQILSHPFQDILEDMTMSFKQCFCFPKAVTYLLHTMIISPQITIS